MSGIKHNVETISTMATDKQLVISLEQGHSVILRRGANGSPFIHVVGQDVVFTKAETLAIFGEGIVGEWLKN